MSKKRDKIVIINRIEEFDRLYLPRPIKRKRADDKINTLGIDLANKIMKKIDIKT